MSCPHWSEYSIYYSPSRASGRSDIKTPGPLLPYPGSSESLHPDPFLKDDVVPLSKKGRKDEGPGGVYRGTRPNPEKTRVGFRIKHTVVVTGIIGYRVTRGLYNTMCLNLYPEMTS